MRKIEARSEVHAVVDLREPMPVDHKIEHRIGEHPQRRHRRYERQIEIPHHLARYGKREHRYEGSDGVARELLAARTGRKALRQEAVEEGDNQKNGNCRKKISQVKHGVWGF